MIVLFSISLFSKPNGGLALYCIYLPILIASTRRAQIETNKGYFKGKTTWFLNIGVFRSVRHQEKTDLRECLPTFGPESFFFLPSFFLLAQQPPVGHGLLIYEVSRSHTTTHHSR
jgi:hypothetical protein